LVRSTFSDLTTKKSLLGIFLLAMAGLAFYFIFQGMELVGIGMLIVCALLEYRLMKVKKTA